VEDHNPLPPVFAADATGKGDAPGSAQRAHTIDADRGRSSEEQGRDSHGLTSSPHCHSSGSGVVYYVDYAQGSDSNDGSQSHPFKTIAQAVAKAESGGGGATINLREGTHYVLDTIQVTPSAANVVIQNYNGAGGFSHRKKKTGLLRPPPPILLSFVFHPSSPPSHNSSFNSSGERAIVSGGKTIKPEWKPYNVTPTPPSPPPPAPSNWVTQDNYNYVFGCNIDNKTYILLGKPQNKDDCESMCKAHSGCHAYTWHDANQGSYAYDCIGRTDGASWVRVLPRFRSLRLPKIAEPAP
jgi:hypothetical protein